MNEELAHELLRRIDIADGRLLAQEAAIKAIITAHPARELALRTVQVALETMIAAGLNATVSEDTIDGYRRAQASLLPS